MKIPKRHHFVPEFLIKQFAVDGGTVRAWFKEQKTVLDILSKDLFVVGHFHSRFEKDGSRDPSLEVSLARLEGVVSPILKSIIDCIRVNRAVQMDQQDKMMLDVFIYLQFRRVPDRFENYRTEIGFDDVLRESIEEWQETYPERAHELEEMNLDDMAMKVFHNSRIKAIRDFRGPAFKAFNRRGVDIVRIDPRVGKQFVLGSNPVLPFPNLLEDGTVQLWLPIAPDVIIGPGPIGNEIRQIDTINKDAIRRFNLGIAAQSKIVASASNQLLQSIRFAR